MFLVNQLWYLSSIILPKLLLYPLYKLNLPNSKSKSELSEKSLLPTEYKYRPLEFADSFRLIELFPSKDGDDIRICLHHVTLNTAPGYQTLSYEWGKARNVERRNEILCDGFMLRITDNLKDALLRIRFPTLKRYVWVDALCIDQENVEERGQQVAIMELIYAYGHKVLVWLGEAGPYTSQAMDALKDAAKLAVDRPLHYNEDRIDHNLIIYYRSQNLVAPDPGETASIGIMDIFTRSYFERRWIIQEIVHSPRIVVMCGKYEIDWMDLYRGMVHSPVCREMKEPHFLSTVQNIQEVRRVHQNERPPFGLIDLVRIFPRSKATVGRDNIYSMYSLLHGPRPGRELGVRPDYSISDAEAYTDIAMSFRGQFWHMWNCFLPPGMSKIPGKPSWVPDFGNPNTDRLPILTAQTWSTPWEQGLGDGKYYRYDTNPLPTTPSLEPKRMEIKVGQALIDGIYGIWFANAEFEGKVLRICETFSEDDAELLLEESTISESVRGAAITSVDANDTQSREEYVNFKSWMSTTWPELGKSVSNPLLTDKLVKHKRGRQLFVSECGTLGFGPLGGGLEVGDHLISNYLFRRTKQSLPDPDPTWRGIWAIRADPERKDPKGNPVYAFIGPTAGWVGWNKAEDRPGIDIMLR